MGTKTTAISFTLFLNCVHTKCKNYVYERELLKAPIVLPNIHAEEMSAMAS